MLVSIDSTLKSNLSVGLPIDLVVYKADSLHSESHVHRRGEPLLRHDPVVLGASACARPSMASTIPIGIPEARYPLNVASERYPVLRKIQNPNEKII